MNSNRVLNQPDPDLQARRMVSTAGRVAAAKTDHRDDQRKVGPLTSAIYEGVVRHRRNVPSLHQFDFRFFMLLLDLDELDRVFRWQPLWSTKRWALCRFNRSDHLKKHRSAGSLRRRVDRVLAEHDMDTEIGPIRLLTQLSLLGFSMNPVSFFYCYDRDGQKIVAIIAEVNNTPWGEQHCYVVPGHQLESGDTVRSAAIKKDFHVSPFFNLNMNYRMAFSVPSETLAVKIENHSLAADQQGPRKLIDVTMSLRRKKLTWWKLNGLLLRYPLITFRVFAGIYWQALKLYWKKIPFVPHPRRSNSIRTTSGNKST